MRNIAWKTVIVTFVISFTAGVLLGRCVITKRIHQKWKDPQAKQEWIMKKLDRGLDLNAGQEEKISVILAEEIPKLMAIKAGIRPQMEAVKDLIKERITPVLTPEQQKKYAQMEEEWKKRREKRYGRAVGKS